MRKIKGLTEDISEELESAKEYAEKYLELRAENNTKWAGRFKTMAEDEINHAMILHDYAVEEINALKEVYTPPESMLDKWEKSHADYVEKTAWVKMMLSI